MNKYTFIASVSVALFFAACGDDSSSVEPSLDESSSRVVLSSSSSFSVIPSSSSVSSPMSSWSGGGAGAIGSITDSRDGQSYKTVSIGTQTWMAQNLNYETANSYCYGDTPSNCTKYGRLYTWAAAKTACPTGWYLPTKAEFETLFTAVGGSSTAGKMLKSTSGWNDFEGKSGNGVDAYSFSALPAGFGRADESYSREGYSANFWSSTEYNSNDAYIMYLSYNYDYAYLNYDFKYYGFSVRCVFFVIPSSSSVSSPMSSWSGGGAGAIGSITDSRDGQSYKTVSIGTQTWMAQNLNYETANSYCYSDSPSNCTKYGRLYTWAAAKTACPTGWHLPAYEEFKTLFTAVGGSTGTKLKSTSGWNSGGNSVSGTDNYSFSALPAGYRSESYHDEGRSAYFWSSSEYDRTYAYLMTLGFSGGSANLGVFYKYDGFSVRCVKD